MSKNTSNKDSVAQAAKLLDMSEREFFDMAFTHWFEQMPKPEEMENAFNEYQQEGDIPYWVSYAASKTLGHKKTVISPPKQHPLPTLEVPEPPKPPKKED